MRVACERSIYATSGVAQIHVRFAAVSRLSRAVSRMSRAVSQLCLVNICATNWLRIDLVSDMSCDEAILASCVQAVSDC
eukprot:1888298-Prymnesium_polylepis.1